MTQFDQIKNFGRLASLCGTSQTLLAARNTGLLTALDGPPKTVVELSENCKMPQERLQLVLSVLVSIGAVEQYGEDFALSTALRLANNHPEMLHGSHWQQLPEFLRNELQADNEQALHSYRANAISMQWTLTAAAMSLAELLEIGEQRQAPRILDLGSGSAMWSCAMAYRDGAARITAVDMPDALKAAERTAAEIGVESRVDYLPGDYRHLELPASEFELALAVDLLQLEPLEASRPWLQQVRQALQPGGELVVISRFPGLPLGDLDRALGALELTLRVPSARLHSAADVQDALKTAGFDPQEPQMLDAPPYSVGAIVARANESD